MSNPSLSCASSMSPLLNDGSVKHEKTHSKHMKSYVISSQITPTRALREAVKSIEWWARFFMVNVPTITLKHAPELDRLGSIILSYLVMQVVGFIWAILLSCLVALACKITSFLPYSAVEGEGINQENHQSSQIQLVAAFYVSYASIRVFIAFGQNLYTLALESVSNFPTAAKVLSKGGIVTLSLAQLIFVPALVLQISLIVADYVCLDEDVGITNEGRTMASNTALTTTFYLRHEFCRRSGLNFLTSESGETRRLVFLALVVMVFQLWQMLLQQFPRWSAAFYTLQPWKRSLSQMTVLILFCLTVIAFFVAFFRHDTPTTGMSNYYCIVLFGWTAWLCAFTPTLVVMYGEKWAKRVTVARLQGLAQVVRFSHLCILGILFTGICFFTGFLRAQLDLTILTIVIPTLFSGVYLISYMVIRAGKSLFVLIPVALAASLFVTMHLARTGGNGSVILVFFHILGKLVQYFGEDLPDADDDSIASYDPAEDDEDDIFVNSNLHQYNRNYYATLPEGSQAGVKAEGNEGRTEGRVNDIDEGLHEDKSFDHTKSAAREQTDAFGMLGEAGHSTRPMGGGSSSPSSRGLMNTFEELSLDPIREKKSFDPSSVAMRRHKSSPNLTVQESNISRPLTAANIASARSCDALKDLDTRGARDSSLVSLGLPKNLKEHWVVRMNRRNVAFFWQIARTIVVPDSILSGITRAFWAFAVLLAIILSFLSIGSFAQQRIKFFPNLTDFHRLNNGAILFDHKIANVTLHSESSFSILRNNPNPNLKSKDHKIQSLWARHSRSTTQCSNNSSAGRELGVGGASGRDFVNNLDDSSEYDEDDLMEDGKKLPYYAACSLRWNDLSLLDFALLSEIAYFNDDDQCQSKSPSTSPSSTLHNALPATSSECKQNIVDTVMPGLGFVVRPSASENSGPNFLEVTSEKLNVTIISIRGTDPGRLHDFMEDVKLYAEPVIFTLLSSVFPTIRLWSHDTTSRVIEWLFEMNSFFGLQGEAEYYRPLAERIFQIIDSPEEKRRPIILTGHSLGGGLARIVGTLTKQKSVTFSPPGLGLSYRKYSAQRPDGRIIRASKRSVSKGTMHHHSVAVVTEFDWITQVDRQVGLIQNILCDYEDKAHQNACHLLEGTICHLLQHCGDDKGRFVGCEYDFDLAAISPGVVSFLRSHSWVILPILLLVIMFLVIAIVPELM